MTPMLDYDSNTSENNLWVSPIRPVKFDWSVQGNLAFRIRTHPDIVMSVLMTETIPYEQNAVKVCALTLQHISHQLQDAVTRKIIES